MFVLVIANQRITNRFARRLAADVTMAGLFFRIAFAVNNRADDLHAGSAGDVLHDMMQLQIHLHQRLLHVLDMCCGILE